MHEYSGVEADLYDLWFLDESAADDAYFRKQLSGLALEVGCGTGRLLIPYAQSGLDIDGVDSSSDMLTICRRKASALGLNPTLFHQRMQNLTLDRTYEAIFIPLNSYMLVTDRDHAAEALLRFRQHLRPRGRLIVTLSQRWGATSLPGGSDAASQDRVWSLRRRATRPGDGTVVLVHEAGVRNLAEQLYEGTFRYEIYADGRLTQSHLRIVRLRWYTKHEFTLMLERAGFEVLSTYGDYTDEQFNSSHTTMVFHATPAG